MPNARVGRTEIFSGEPILRGEIETRGARSRHAIRVGPGAAETTGTSIATQGGPTSPMCVPNLRYHLRRQKFWIIWPGIRTLKTPSTASFIGGCSTPASKNGRRKLRRPSRNSSNEASSRKSYPRTAKYFTTFPRIISRRFSNSNRQTPKCDAFPIMCLQSAAEASEVRFHYRRLFG
jgi:hypothetical protein